MRVNLLTTIAEPRIKLLVQQGAPYVDALAQATNELFAAFAIDGSAVGDLVTLDLTGANDGAAALIGVSSVLLEYASEQAAAPSERVAELSLATSQIATALKTTGSLPTALTKALAKAAHDLDIGTIESNLIGIFVELGTHIVLPEIDPYVDPLAARYPRLRALLSDGWR